MTSCYISPSRCGFTSVCAVLLCEAMPLFTVFPHVWPTHLCLHIRWKLTDPWGWLWQVRGRHWSGTPSLLAHALRHTSIHHSVALWNASLHLVCMLVLVWVGPLSRPCSDGPSTQYTYISTKSIWSEVQYITAVLWMEKLIPFSLEWVLTMFNLF